MVSVLPLSSCCQRLPDSPAVHLLCPHVFSARPNIAAWFCHSARGVELPATASNSPPCLINRPGGEGGKKSCSPDRMTCPRDHLISEYTNINPVAEWMMGKTECRLTQCRVSPLADLPSWIVYLFKWRTNVDLIKIMCQRLICKHPVVIIMIGQWLLVEHCYALSS